MFTVSSQRKDDDNTHKKKNNLRLFNPGETFLRGGKHLPPQKLKPYEELGNH